jgi:hypothetical protein
MSKTKSPIYVRVFLPICLLLIANGCSTEKSNPNFVDPTAHPELIDQSWLTGKPCAAPCWQGLEPGKTSRDDALKTVPRLSFLRSKNYINPDDLLISFYCEKPREKVCMKMRYENKVLSELALYPNYSITLDDVVAQLGEPDSFLLSDLVLKEEIAYFVFSGYISG